MEVHSSHQGASAIACSQKKKEKEEERGLIPT